MGYSHIINSDNMTPIEELPTRIELNEEWSISERDLKHLVLGPLTKGKKVLVPAYPSRSFLLSIWQIVVMMATVGGAVGFVQWVFGAC